ncbi:hypothetical protein K9L97_05845 [Candidatus Woesearchaeota archaeon]|nr:hypothetical protein [Candidatus Woesearchaeota archaeon]
MKYVLGILIIAMFIISACGSYNTDIERFGTDQQNTNRVTGTTTNLTNQTNQTNSSGGDPTPPMPPTNITNSTNSTNNDSSFKPPKGLGDDAIIIKEKKFLGTKENKNNELNKKIYDEDIAPMPKPNTIPQTLDNTQYFRNMVEEEGWDCPTSAIFSITGAYEAATKYTTETNVDLSEQNLMICPSSIYDAGDCSTGYDPGFILLYMNKKGATSEEKVPFQDDDSIGCSKFTSPVTPRFKVRSIVTNEFNPDYEMYPEITQRNLTFNDIKEHIYEVGSGVVCSYTYARCYAITGYNTEENKLTVRESFVDENGENIYYDWPYNPNPSVDVYYLFDELTAIAPPEMES